MGKIKKILENELTGGTQSTEVYPITSTKAVYDEKKNRRLSDFVFDKNNISQELGDDSNKVISQSVVTSYINGLSDEVIDIRNRALPKIITEYTNKNEHLIKANISDNVITESDSGTIDLFKLPYKNLDSYEIKGNFWNSTYYYLTDNVGNILESEKTPDSGNKIINIIPKNTKDAAFVYFYFRISFYYVKVINYGNTDDSLDGLKDDIKNLSDSISIQNKPIGFIGRQASAINIPLTESLALNEPFTFIVSVDYISDEESSSSQTYCSGIYSLSTLNGELKILLGTGAYYNNLLCSKISRVGIFGVCKKSGGNTESFAHSALATVNVQEQTSTINTFIFWGSDYVLTKKILLIKGDLNNEDLRLLTKYMTTNMIQLPNHIKSKVVFGIDNLQIATDKFINIADGSEVKFNTPVSLVYEGINVNSKSW